MLRDRSIYKHINMLYLYSMNNVNYIRDEARGGRRGGCRIGAASAVSMCSRRSQNPMSVGDLAKTSLCAMRRSLKFEARVGDKLVP